MGHIRALEGAAGGVRAFDGFEGELVSRPKNIGTGSCLLFQLRCLRCLLFKSRALVLEQKVTKETKEFIGFWWSPTCHASLRCADTEMGVSELMRCGTQ